MIGWGHRDKVCTQMHAHTPKSAQQIAGFTTRGVYSLGNCNELVVGGTMDAPSFILTAVFFLSDILGIGVTQFSRRWPGIGALKERSFDTTIPEP
jgi:hypothetical protein